MGQKSLSDKQLRFIELYCGNATEAAEAAGYRHAKDAGSRCMKNVEICRAIDERRKAELGDEIADRKERQKFWTSTMRDMDQDIKDRMKASELLGRSQADFVERQEHSGPGGGPIKGEWRVTFE